jgi:hypothetical protein
LSDRGKHPDLRPAFDKLVTLQHVLDQSEASPEDKAQIMQQARDQIAQDLREGRGLDEIQPPAPAFPVIEEYRAIIRGMDFERITDQEAAEAKWDYDQAAHSGRLEGYVRPPEMQALFDLIIEERVPQDVAEVIFDRYAQDHVIKRTRAPEEGAHP